MESFIEAYYAPAVLFKVATASPIALDGRADVSKQGFYLPPTVQIASPASESSVTKKNVDIAFSIEDNGGGIGEIICSHNGKVISREIFEPTAVQEEKFIVRSYSVDLVPGKNFIRLIGISKQRIEGVPAELMLFYSKSGQKSKPALYLFSVGINKYKNSLMDLDFSAPDAQSISSFFKKNHRKLFSDIKIFELTDQEATKERILDNLEHVASIGSSQDTVILYFSGHGETVKDQWYYIPFELTEPDQSALIVKKGLSSMTLQKHVMDIKAHKVFLILDCCKSGAVTVLDDTETKRPFALLSRFTGIHIAAAASKENPAFELRALRHGLMTYTLLEGMGAHADKSPVDRNISVMEVMSYLKTRMPSLSSQYNLPVQKPVLNSMGMDFFISKKL